MSADLLREAARAERGEWGDPDTRRIFPKSSAVHLALADWLDIEVPNAERRERQRQEMEATRVRPAPFPVYYDRSTQKAIAVARAILDGAS